MDEMLVFEFNQIFQWVKGLGSWIVNSHECEVSHCELLERNMTHLQSISGSSFQ